MLLNEFLYRFDLHVYAHLNRCQMLANYLANHFPCNVIKLIIKVCFFQLFEPLYNILNLFMAIITIKGNK